jgi:hypothetical protein
MSSVSSGLVSARPAAFSRVCRAAGKFWRNLLVGLADGVAHQVFAADCCCARGRWRGRRRARVVGCALHGAFQDGDGGVVVVLLQALAGDAELLLDVAALALDVGALQRLGVELDDLGLVGELLQGLVGERKRFDEFLGVERLLDVLQSLAELALALFPFARRLGRAHERFGFEVDSVNLLDFLEQAEGGGEFLVGDQRLGFFGEVLDLLGALLLAQLFGYPGELLLGALVRGVEGQHGLELFFGGGEIAGGGAGFGGLPVLGDLAGAVAALDRNLLVGERLLVGGVDAQQLVEPTDGLVVLLGLQGFVGVAEEELDFSDCCWLWMRS